MALLAQPVGPEHLTPSPTVLYRNPQLVDRGRPVGTFIYLSPTLLTGVVLPRRQVSSTTLNWFASDGSGEHAGEPERGLPARRVPVLSSSNPYSQPKSGHFFLQPHPASGQSAHFHPDQRLP
jgi:hypothetical protein